MGLIDLAVLSALGLAAAYPLLKAAIQKASAFTRRAKVDSPDAVEQWRQRWTALLITLGREIESGEGGLPRKDQALMLSKELMWEIIGGDTAPKTQP